METCTYSNRPIISFSSLEKCLGLPVQKLQAVAALDDQKKYKDPKTPVYKKDGTLRKVKTPSKELRSIQYRINREILKRGVKWPSYLFGSIPKNSLDEKPQDYINAAATHCRKKSICSLDISNFFDNIHRDEVKNIFLNLFRFSDPVSELLTELVTYEKHLVQGALTSSYLAMLILWDVEPLLVNRISRKGVAYSRLVDDITLSSHAYNYDFSLEIKLIEDKLHSKGLFLNKKKIKTSSISSELLLVHGLNITNKKPALPRREAKKIRANVRHSDTIITILCLW